MLFRYLLFKNPLIILLAVFSLSPFYAQTQAPCYFNYFGLKQGLSQSTVNAICQDSLGYLWIATNDGLNRYDGYTFKQYLQNPAQTGLETGISKSLLTDYFGRLWLSADAIYHYDPTQDRFIKHKDYRPDLPTGATITGKLHIDHAGQIWFLCKNHICVIRPGESVISTYDINRAVPGVDFQNVVTHGKEWIIVTSNTAIYKLKREELLARHHELSVKSYSFESNDFVRYHDFYSIEEDRFLLATNQGLWELSGNKLVISSLISDSLAVRQEFKAIETDAQNRLWLAGKNAFYVGDRLSQSANLQTQLPAEEIPQSTQYIQTVFRDRYNILWVGTNKGLYQLNLSRKAFETFHQLADGGSIGMVKAIYQDKQALLWLGHDGGLSIWDLHKDSSRLLSQKSFDPRFLVGDNVLSIEKTDDYILIGGVGISIFKNQKPWGIIYPVEDNPHSLPAWIVWFLHYGQKSGLLWVATTEGLAAIKSPLDSVDYWQISSPKGHIFRKLNPDFEIYSHKKGDANSLPGGHVWAMQEDRHGLLWVGTNGGLCVISPQDKTVWRFPIKGKGQGRLTGKTVSCIHCDKEGNIWVGVENGGLNKIIPIIDTTTLVPRLVSYDVKHYTTDNGLMSNNIWGILQDDSGCLWLSSTKGLMRFFPNSEQVQHYDHTDGLQSDEFTRGAYYRGADGMIYFGGMNGFSRFKPEAIANNPFAPTILITGLSIHGKMLAAGDTVNGDVVLKKAIWESESIALSWRNAIFSFHFTGFHFAAPDRIRYAYKLEGLDDEWHYTDAGKRDVRYMNLPPGEYRFIVRACNADGLWSQASSIRVLILPPFWKTLWFKILILTLLSFLLLLLIRLKMRRIKKENILLEKQVKERTQQIELQKEELITQADNLQEINATKDKLMSIIAHDLRNPFHAIYGFSEALTTQFNHLSDQQKLDFIASIMRSSKSAADLLDQLLAWAGTQTGKLRFRPEAFNLTKVLQEIKSLLGVTAENKQIDLYLDVPNVLPVYADRSMLTFVIRNLISNAIKFTPAGGEVSVEVSQEKDKMSIAVRDTGIGMSADLKDRLFETSTYQVRQGTSGERGTGLGLKVCREFIQQHRGILELESREAAGSLFRVILPQRGDVVHLYQDEQQQLNRSVEDDKQKQTVQEQFSLSDEKYMVLVIDDSAQIRESLKAVLSTYFRVEQAQEAQEGLRMAQELLPDIILSDVMMPGMNGLELANRLKQNERTSHIPLILLTARSQDRHVIEGLESGADNYITKPFTAEVLLAKMMALLKHQEALRQKLRRELLCKPSNIVIENTEERLLKKAMSISEKYIDDHNFGLNHFEEEMGLSRAQLYRKLKALTDYSPMEFLRMVRMKRAAQLLRESDLTISEIIYQVGFSDQASFRRHFKKHFQYTPSDYREAARQSTDNQS